MPKITLKKIFLTTGLLISFLFANTIYAVCPLCTVAVGAGIGLAQWLGIDDAITGVWIGGLTVSLIMWTIDWLSGKVSMRILSKLIIVIGYYAIIFIPLYYSNIIGHQLNKLWGIDKLVLGALVGSILFLLSSAWYINLKRKNNGHAYFPFQKVFMPLGFLFICSIIFYFLTR